jgi:hypothetical protein
LKSIARCNHYSTREQGNVGRWKKDNNWYRYPGGRGSRRHRSQDGENQLE